MGGNSPEQEEEKETELDSTEKFFGKMWEKQEEMAILFGIDLGKYWDMNPKTFKKYVKVYGDREIARMVEQDIQNYNLGKYISFAYHKPKDYPKKPFLDKLIKKPKKRVMTDEEMERQGLINTILLGGKVNK